MRRSLRSRFYPTTASNGVYLQKAITAWIFAFTFTLVMLVSTSVCAQFTCPPFTCPSSDWLPGQVSFTMPDPCGTGGTVTVYACFCYVDPNSTLTPKQMMELKSITIQPASPCPVSKQWVRTAKEQILEKHITGSGACIGVQDCSDWCAEHPNCVCGSAQPSWEFTAGNCMRAAITTTQTTYYDCYFTGPCLSVYEVCCYSGMASVRWLTASPEISDCDNEHAENCVLVCGRGASEPEIGCKDANGNSTPCCCGGGCPDTSGGCPEDTPCPDENGYLTVDRCCDGSCPEINACPDVEGNLMRNRCCDGTCPDVETGECE